jgi:O-antigen/teichoic acid export membrane protein
MSHSLRVRTARGSLVTSLASTFIRIIALVGAVLLARLLDPAAFGLVAMATIVLQATHLFAGLGMRAAVVHSKLDRPTLAFHAFLISGTVGVLLYLLVAFNTTPLARLLGDEGVADLLQWMALIILFDALATVPETLLRKDLLFGRHSIAHAIPELLYVLVAVFLAMQGVGVWSLAYAALARSAFGMILYWSLCPGWDWLKVRMPSRHVFRSLLRYGFQVMLTGLFSFTTKIWDNFLVGRVLGSTDLGHYSRAFFFANLPATSLEQVVGNVLFASYVRLQDDTDRLARAYLRSLRMLAMLTVPTTLGIFVIAPVLVPVVLGDAWVPMVPALQILSVACLVGLLPRSTGPLILALGRPGLNTRIAALQAVSIIALTLALVDYGIEGIAVAVLASLAIAFLYMLYLLEGAIPGIRRKIPAAIGPILAAGLAMAVIVHLAIPVVQEHTGGAPNPAGLLLLVLLGAITYPVALGLLDRTLLMESAGLVRDSFAAKRAGRGR